MFFAWDDVLRLDGQLFLQPLWFCLISCTFCKRRDVVFHAFLWQNSSCLDR